MTIFQTFILINIQIVPLEKTVNMHNVMILIKSTGNRNHNNYYYQPFFEKCTYKCIRSYMIELIFLKLMMLIRPAHLRNVLFITIGIF